MSAAESNKHVLTAAAIAAGVVAVGVVGVIAVREVSRKARLKKILANPHIRPRHPVAAGSVVVGEARSTGVLLQDIKSGKIASIDWSTIEVQELDLRFEVTTDAIKNKDGLRLPISYLETIEACQSLDPGKIIAPSKKLCDAIYSAAVVKTVFHSLVLTADDAGARMLSMDFAKKFNVDIDGQIDGMSGLTAGAWKYWILNSRLVEIVNNQPAAVNYGGWDAKGKPFQSVGGKHDGHHSDYSQLLQPVLRAATRISDGSAVDLLDWIETNEHVPAKYTEVFR